jgi:glycosyltransferase involved in cell wall biosynthesis
MATHNNPTLSICIPTYNRSALLLNLLRVMDKADYLPFAFDVIVIDNASTDPGYVAIAAFEPAHYAYQYLRRPENIGGFPNLYGSYRLARGEFCLHLSDDDFLLPDQVAQIVDAMRNAPNCVATFAAWQMYDGETDQVIHEPRFEDISVTLSDAATLASRMTRWSLSVPENGIYRTSSVGLAFYQANVINMAFRVLERLLLTGRVDFRSQAFYRVVSRHKGEQGDRNHTSGSLGVDGWSAMARGVAVFHRFATREPLCDMAASGESLLYLTLLRNAVYEASNRGQFLQAADMMDYIASLTSAELFTPDQTAHIRHMAALDGIATEIAALPGISRIHVIGLGPEAEPLRQLFVSRQSPLAFLPSPYPTADLAPASAAVVVPTDAMRNQLVALYAMRPGYVFSLEAAQRCLGG